MDAKACETDRGSFGRGGGWVGDPQSEATPRCSIEAEVIEADAVGPVRR